MATEFDPFESDEAAALEESRRVGDKQPYMQWFAASELIKHKDYFLKNLLHGMAICAGSRIIAPSWLAEPFSASFQAAMDEPAKSWDHVFGTPVPKGRHRATFHRVETQRLTVMARVEGSVFGTPPGSKFLPIDKGYWECIAAGSGVGATRAEELYREAVRDGADSIEEMRKRHLEGLAVASETTFFEKAAGVLKES